MAIRYPRRLKLALTPTPLEFMPRLTQYFGGPEIWFKRDDLTGSTLSGNKVRKLEFSLAEAGSQKASVIITAGGIQSNHCRATALCCARLGLECHLILRGEPDGSADGNLLLDYLAGAKLAFYPREVYSTQKHEIAAQIADKYATAGKKSYWIPVGASNAIGSWGYVRAYEELLRQAARQNLHIDHIVNPIGSGGTSSGLIAGRALTRARKPQVWGINVCDDEPTFQHDIRQILEEMNARFDLRLNDKNTPVQVLDGYVGDGYAIPYDQEMALISECGRLEGQILDPVYTGKALYGLQQEIRKGRFSKKERVVFIHTGGVFGLFPQKHGFQFNGSSNRPKSTRNPTERKR
ncbi:MAG: 1-aminocyclopropane-1-carboxylate deaminase/D-cysteine desulfhydrase [Candidatus Sumerlaeaceae bacterium]